MVEASSRERDEFGPVVSVWRFLGLLVLVLFGGSGLLEFHSVALDRNWAGSSHTVVQVRAGVESGLAVGAAVACVVFGRVRRDLFHRSVAWSALIVVGPLATILGQTAVASWFGAFVAPAAEVALTSWARMALECALAAGTVALGLLFLRREPTRWSRLLYACGALGAVVALAIIGREFDLDSFTSPMRHACVLPLVLRTRARSIPKAVVLATVVLAISGVFIGVRLPRFGAQWEIVLAMGLWLGAALPLALARRYDALGDDLNEVELGTTRRWAGAAVVLLLVSPLVAIGRGASTLPPPAPMPPTVWIQLTQRSASDGDEITVESFAVGWRITLAPGGPPLMPRPHIQTLSPKELWDLGEGWWRSPVVESEGLSGRWVYAIERPWHPSGLDALLPRARSREVLAVFESADQPEIHGGRRYLRFDLRPDDDR